MLQIEKGQDIKQELLQKYKTILPDELTKFWKDYGFGRLVGGYLKVINPEDYQELLNETYFRGNISVPILTTAFGDDYFLEKYFQVPQYTEAVNKLGNLEQDECFGYVPLLGLGGSEKVDNLDKVKIREHIELISQMVGKIGM